ncbi:hypothetical protein [Candidatus Palauibacter sp.]|uniref:hypothetical protein n=1 Tax=Candidatus Palauibacter sp. TaxID=3101350 RepID=UPI003CC5DF27
MKPRIRSILWLVLLGVVLPAAAYVVVHRLFLAQPASPATVSARLDSLGIDPATINPDTLSPRLAKTVSLVTRKPVHEYVVVVISSNQCRASEIAGFNASVNDIRRLVDGQLAHRPEAVTRMVGVALDEDPKVGADYLSRLGNFDEIVAGSGWFNLGTEKYLWGSYNLRATTPQVVLFERTVRYVENGVLVSDERVIRAISGAQQIIEWVGAGAPFIE